MRTQASQVSVAQVSVAQVSVAQRRRMYFIICMNNCCKFSFQTKVSILVVLGCPCGCLHNLHFFNVNRPFRFYSFGNTINHVETIAIFNSSKDTITTISFIEVSV